jgi:hypothetical protein
MVFMVTIRIIGWRGILEYIFCVHILHVRILDHHIHSYVTIYVFRVTWFGGIMCSLCSDSTSEYIIMCSYSTRIQEHIITCSFSGYAPLGYIPKTTSSCSRRFGRWGCSLMMSAAVAETVVVYTRLICSVCNRSK